MLGLDPDTRGVQKRITQFREPDGRLRAERTFVRA